MQTVTLEGDAAPSDGRELSLWIKQQGVSSAPTFTSLLPDSRFKTTTTLCSCGLFLIPTMSMFGTGKRKGMSSPLLPSPQFLTAPTRVQNVPHSLKTLRPLRDLINFKNTGYTASGHSLAFTTNCCISRGNTHFIADRQLSGKPKSRQREAECKS